MGAAVLALVVRGYAVRVIYDFDVCTNCNEEITPEVGAVFPGGLCPRCFVLLMPKKEIARDRKIIQIQFQ